MTVRSDRLHRTRVARAILSWFGVALLTIWTVSALGIFVVLDTGTRWLVETHGSGWPVAAAEAMASIDGFTVGGLWLVGSVLILAVTLLLRRLVSPIG